jgi:hypothetical protein
MYMGTYTIYYSRWFFLFQRVGYWVPTCLLSLLLSWYSWTKIAEMYISNANQDCKYVYSTAAILYVVKWGKFGFVSSLKANFSLIMWKCITSLIKRRHVTWGHNVSWMSFL